RSLLRADRASSFIARAACAPATALFWAVTAPFNRVWYSNANCRQLSHCAAAAMNMHERAIEKIAVRTTNTFVIVLKSDSLPNRRTGRRHRGCRRYRRAAVRRDEPGL